MSDAKKILKIQRLIDQLGRPDARTQTIFSWKTDATALAQKLEAILKETT